MIMAKIGLDGHDRGAKVVARGLRDAGVEVIYPGLRNTPLMVARIAMEEDIDVICVSILSGAHVGVCTRLRQSMLDLGIEDIPVVVGGIIPEEDEAVLEQLGVWAVFGPGTHMKDITEAVVRFAFEVA